MVSRWGGWQGTDYSHLANGSLPALRVGEAGRDCGRWYRSKLRRQVRRSPVPDASPDQNSCRPPTLAAELGSGSSCTCCCRALPASAATAVSLSLPRPIFFKVPLMTIHWVCSSCTAADIDCSRFVRPTVDICHGLTQRPLAFLSQDKDSARVN